MRLESIDLERHVESLFEAACSDAAIWEYLPHGPFENRHDFRAWLEWAIDSTQYLFFVVIDDRTGCAEGMMSYMRVVPPHGVIETGYIWLGTRLQRTTPATEAIYLLLHHAFDDLRYRRVEWKCDALNGPSRRAAQHFGFRYGGIFRQHMVVTGRNRDTAWYAILDHEWPSLRAAFEVWLAPENFDRVGKQRQLLSAIRTGTTYDGGRLKA